MTTQEIIDHAKWRGHTHVQTENLTDRHGYVHDAYVKGFIHGLKFGEKLTLERVSKQLSPQYQ